MIYTGIHLFMDIRCQKVTSPRALMVIHSRARRLRNRNGNFPIRPVSQARTCCLCAPPSEGRRDKDNE